MKKIIIVVFLLLILSSILFAAGSNEAMLIYFPRESVNNSNYAFELPLDSTPINLVQIPEVAFSSFSTNGNELFRIRTTLEENVTVRLEPGANGWNFVHENNSTIVRPFEVDVVQHNLNHSFSGYNLDTTTGPTTYPFGGLVLDSTVFGGWISHYALEINDYDFIIRFPTSVTFLEPGYYNASFILSVDETNAIPNTTINIRGYYNVNHNNETGSGNYLESFIVSPTNYTTSMDLSDSTSDIYYNVANISMNATEITNTDPQNNQTTLSNRYTILISPKALYSDTGDYQFIRIGSENVSRTPANTVVYELASADGYSFSSPPSTLDGASEVGELSPTTTKYVKPNFDYIQTATGGFGTPSQWYMEWTMNYPLWIKIPSNQGNHGSGIYQSTIYVTLKVE